MYTNLNVYKYGWEKGIINRIKLFFRRLKWARQRITKGYCDYDLWDSTGFYTKLIPKMLRQLAEETDGYPTELDFEQWQEILKRIAFCIEQSSMDNDLFTEEWSRYFKLLSDEKTSTNVEEINKAREEWIKAAETRSKEREKMKEEAFQLLSKYWYALWW